MNIVVTGSLGNISKPLTKQLIEQGHSVTVISSKAERENDIEALGAKAAIGTILDVDFLTATFKGADVVYLMGTFEATGNLFDKNIDFVEGYLQIGKNYKQAVEQSGVKKVIYLSSVGADKEDGNGILFVYQKVENMLRELSDDVAIKFMRPVSFYTNIFRSLQSIKTQGVIVSNYGGDIKEPWVSPVDIATVIAEEIEKPFDDRTIHYIASEEISPNEIAKIIGQAIEKPELKWQVIPDEQLLNGMLSIGMNPQLANGLVEMQAAQRSGFLYESYYLNKPILGKTKMTDFAKEFAEVYNQSK